VSLDGFIAGPEVPRLPFQGNETSGSIANGLPLPAAREPHR
jgi:hypothetical protein